MTIFTCRYEESDNKLLVVSADWLAIWCLLEEAAEDLSPQA